MLRFALAATVILLASRPAHTKVLISRFMKETPKAWAISDKLFEQLEGTITMTTKLDDGDFYERGVIRYLRTGECQFLGNFHFPIVERDCDPVGV